MWLQNAAQQQNEGFGFVFVATYVLKAQKII